jgi:glutathione S-transferase
MSNDAVLYGMPMSHYCTCADRVLAFKGVNPRSVAVPYHDKRELIAATAQDYVPALVWDGQVVPWKEIADFMERARPEPTLYPYGLRALANVIDNWGHLVLEETVWRAVVTRIPPVLSDPVERWVFEEMQSRVRGPWHVLELRRAEFWEEMLRSLRVVDGMVADKPWILGAPSLADFGVFGGLSPLLVVGESVPPEFPHLAKWVERIQQFGGATAQ